MKKISYIFLVGIAFLLNSCLGDLDRMPLNENTQIAEKVYTDAASYEKGLLKIYSTWAISGINGNSDIQGFDPGNTQLLRSWWIAQVVSTDEAKVGWGNDAWAKAINEMTWSTTACEPVEAVYHRSMLNVAFVNEFLKALGTAPSDVDVPKMRAEARFCRALAYAVLLDFYAQPPFITEQNYSSAPSQMSRTDLFNWVVGELESIETDLPAARAGVYGRADRGVVNALLARLYLNAEVYTGSAKYDKCIAACEKVIAGGYSLSPKYADLFKADNSTSAAKNEIIFPICFDGSKTTTWGGMTALILGSRGNENDAKNDAIYAGVDGGWGGFRSTQNLVNLFDFSNPSNKTAETIRDKRGIFYSKGRDINITTNPFGTFETEGWGVHKFTNRTSTGGFGSDKTYPDTDFPMFRLADVYLMYAESVARNGGGDKAKAVEYVNKLRERGYGDKSGNIGEAQLTKEFVLNERGRELYWEGTRRSDLIRFGLYTSKDYVWPFKGGSAAGTSVGDYKNIFPIPTSDLTANPNLTPTPGY